MHCRTHSTGLVFPGPVTHLSSALFADFRHRLLGLKIRDLGFRANRGTSLMVGALWLTATCLVPGLHGSSRLGLLFGTSSVGYTTISKPDCAGVSRNDFKVWGVGSKSPYTPRAEKNPKP